MSAVETILNTERESQSNITSAEDAAEAKVAAKKQSLTEELQKEVERLQNWEQEQLEAARVQASTEVEAIMETYKTQSAQVQSQAQSRHAEMVQKIITSF